MCVCVDGGQARGDPSRGKRGGGQLFVFRNFPCPITPLTLIPAPPVPACLPPPPPLAAATLAHRKYYNLDAYEKERAAKEAAKVGQGG